MKKLILTSVVFFISGICLNEVFAQCAKNLPHDLQACFNSVAPGALTVTVIGSNLYIIGCVDDPSLRDQLQSCVDTYNANAANCSGAPVISYDNPPLTNYVSGNAVNPAVTPSNNGYTRH